MSDNLSNDLASLLENESLFVYKKGKSFSDVGAFYFEYQYDLLDIIFYAVDSEFELFCDSVSLLIQKKDIKRFRLMPEKIYRNFQEIEQEISADKIIKHSQEKESILYEWFQKFWDSATSRK